MSHLSRLSATFVLALLLVTPFASARAATTAELQAQIAALLAQIAALQANTSTGNGGGTSGGSTAPVANTPARSYISVTPESGTPPLTVTATMTVDMGTTTCGTVKMGSLVWGDGGVDKVVSEGTSCTREKKDTITHSYKYVGDYHPKFTDLRKESRTAYVGVFVEDAPYIEALTTTSRATESGTIGTYSIHYSVTATDSDIYIPMTSGKAASSGNVYAVTGSPMFAGSDTSVLQSTADRSGKYYVVREGDTENFYLDVSIDPRETGEYKVRLTKIGYATTALKPTASIIIDPKNADFHTPSLNLTENSTVAPWATIDPKDLRITTKNPILTGSVGSTSTVGISIDNGDKVFGSGQVKVINGRWSVKVTTDLANGTYNLKVYSANNVELAKGVMQVKLASPTPAI